MNPIRRILVPVDFSSCSRAAFSYALAIAERVGAIVEVLHVYTSPALASSGAVAVSDQPQLHLSDWSLVARRNARKAWEELVGSDRHTPFRLREGVVADAILSVASEGEFDLIVMGTHGRTGFSHLLRGSVAERVVRSSEKPVITIKA